MKKSNQLSIGALLALAISFSVQGEIVTFSLIPDAASANDITPDGRFIVGTRISDSRPYRLDTVTNTMITLPMPGLDAVAVSDDGKVILGDMPDPVTGAEVAAIWTEQSGVWQSLGYLPNANQCPSLSNGYELSADGTAAVGLSWVGCSGRGVRWTQATGMIELPVLANGSNRASVTSGDGLLIGGFAQGSFSRTPAIWYWNGAVWIGQLLDPPGGDAVGEVHFISPNGTVLLGEWNGLATQWTYPGLVRTTIGTGSILPGWSGIPQAQSAQTGTIVGFDVLLGNRRAWIQPNGVGPLVDLKSYIEGFGGVVPTNVGLQVCQAITADGSKIIGHSSTPGAWLVTISPSCETDITGDGLVNVSDLLAVINAWGPCPAPPIECPADIAGNDGMVDVSDLLAVINTWGSCPGAQGACCIKSSCVLVTEQECLNANGTYLGDSVPCTINACQNNDFCHDAIDITGNINGAAVMGDNSVATPPFGGDPELPVGSPSCHWNQNPGAARSTVWYSFIAPANGSVTVDTCVVSGTLVDSTLALYSGGCGTLAEIACDEDGCSGEFPYYSRIIANSLTPGVKYFVCVMNPGDWSGSLGGEFTLTITSPK